jgi:hypothetical protein
VISSPLKSSNCSARPEYLLNDCNNPSDHFLDQLHSGPNADHDSVSNDPEVTSTTWRGAMIPSDTSKFSAFFANQGNRSAGFGGGDAFERKNSWPWIV